MLANASIGAFQILSHWRRREYVTRPFFTFLPLTRIMTIRLTLPEQEPDYIRHARIETLKNIGEKVVPEAIEPQPIALTFLAYDNASDTKPIGLAEIAFHEQIYPSYAEGPYPNTCDLAQFCPFAHMAGIRTIFVEPGYRHKAAALYLQLVYAGAQVAHGLGAKFGTASTRADNHYLRRLYERTGGTQMGPFQMEGAAEEVVLFVFEITALLEHKLMRRAVAETRFDLDPTIAHTIRSRSLVRSQRQCA